MREIEVDMEYLEERALAALRIPKDIDMHTARAMKMYEVSANEVTQEMRDVAKTLNYIDAYGGLYGKG